MSFPNNFNNFRQFQAPNRIAISSNKGGTQPNVFLRQHQQQFLRQQQRQRDQQQLQRNNLLELKKKQKEHTNSKPKKTKYIPPQLVKRYQNQSRPKTKDCGCGK